MSLWVSLPVVQHQIVNHNKALLANRCACSDVCECQLKLCKVCEVHSKLKVLTGEDMFTNQHLALILCGM